MVLASATHASAQSRCGVERWPVKIGADDDAALVDSVPIEATVAQLIRASRPAATFENRRRIGPLELQTFRVRGRLVRVIAQDDGDIHLVLRDLNLDSLTMIAEIPSPACTADVTMAQRFATSRQALRGTPRGAIVEIVGIGFFDFPHGQSGAAGNGFELHPVLSLEVFRDWELFSVSGFCGRVRDCPFSTS